MKFESMRSSGLVERIRDELHRAIISGRMAPGATLTESLIATEMEVSRAPVREALRLLEESGLVEKTPNRPYRVAEFAETDLADLASMRIALEELAVRLAVGADPDLAPAHAALEQMRTASAGGSTYEIIAADRAFHEALIWAAGNPRLTAAYSRLRDQIQLALLTNLSDGTSVLGDIHERHVDLLDRYVDTIRGGDPAILLPLLEQHIAGGMGVPTPEPWPTSATKRRDAATA